MNLRLQKSTEAVKLEVVDCRVQRTLFATLQRFIVHVTSSQDLYCRFKADAKIGLQKTMVAKVCSHVERNNATSPHKTTKSA